MHRPTSTRFGAFLIAFGLAIIAAAAIAAIATATPRWPECHKTHRQCVLIKRVHNECNTWACTRRVERARARRERAAARKMRTGLSYVTASWYGPGLYGNHVACAGYGVLTTATFGVAHKTLPCGTRVVLCAARCTVAPVIDRGPYVGGRTFDLTAPVRDTIGAGSLTTVGYKIAS